MIGLIALFAFLRFARPASAGLKQLAETLHGHMSLLPKSITAPIAMGIAAQIGGNPTLTAAYGIITGIVGTASSRHPFAAAGSDFHAFAT